ncbi:MAG: AzlD domain-containing protein [Leptothrix sp. (in: b-proteobacteria)]
MSTLPTDFWTSVLIIVGLALVTMLTRSFFMLSDHELPMPAWARRALRFAPLAALTAIVVPEIVLTQGALVHTLADARLVGTAAGLAWFFWRRGILGTIVTGMAVFLPLRILWGW